MVYFKEIEEIQFLISKANYDLAKKRIDSITKEYILIYALAKICSIQIDCSTRKYDEALEKISQILNEIHSFQDENDILLSVKIAAETYKSYILYRLGNIEEGLNLMLNLKKSLRIDKLFSDTLEYTDSDIKEKFYLIQNLSLYYQGCGVLYQGLQEYNDYILSFEKSLALNIKIGNKIEIANDFMSLGIVYFNHKGDLNKAIQYHLNAISIREEIDDELGKMRSLSELSRIYDFRGELEKALEYNFESLKIAEERKIHRSLIKFLGDTGIIYYKMGKNEDALNYFRKHVNYYANLDSPYASGEVYLYMILMNIENEHIQGERDPELNDLIELVYSRIQQYLKENIGDYLRGYFEYVLPLTKAIQLKEKKRSKYRAEAQKILISLTESKIVDIELTQLTILHLSEILLDELAFYQEENILKQTESLISHYRSDAESQNAFTLLIDAMLLQSRLLLIRGNIPEAHSVLEEAAVVARENKLNKWLESVDYHKTQLALELHKWEELLRKSAPVQERLKMANIQTYLRKMQQMKIQNTKEILD
ncbi:MAG: tetratricopeptide repeat protein [Candidatus Heimdallarchaeota archaeon]|nr:tetratricopeptide repeat protein [Candidatus Heimdallarchaeota archaeon]